MDICGFEGCSRKILVLACWRQHTWPILFNWTNFSHLFVLISSNVRWLKRIDSSRCFEINVRDIPVVHWVIWSDSVGVGSRKMTWTGCSALDIFNIHEISGSDIQLSLFGWSWARNIINRELISDESCRFWSQIIYWLQIIVWIERIFSNSCGFKLNTLWLSTINIICS